MKKYLTLLIIALAVNASAQVNPRDSAIRAPMFYVNYAYQIPGGDMARRFGGNSSLGGGFQYKMKSNWILGGEFTYIFGNRVKNQETLFSLISNSDGFIIDNSGEYAEVVVSENGFNASLKIGKIFPWFGPNKNCGPVFSLQPGFFQHKVKILNIGNTAPQLRGDYKKGYDELANGFSITEFIGYFYMGNRRLVSFYAGFEFTQAFTSNRRPYSFNNMERTGGTNLDLLYSVRIGWMIPIYKRAPAGYYY